MQTALRRLERAGFLTGLSVSDRSVRFCYRDKTIAHILGKAGLEKALESYLHGIDGKETLVTDITGEVIQRYVSTEPQPGDNCFLTIDLDLQEVAEQALAETIENIRRKGAASRTGAGADAACRDAYARLAAERPRTALVDWRVDRPENREPDNYFDHTHYRRKIAGPLAADIAAAIIGLR